MRRKSLGASILVIVAMGLVTSCGEPLNEREFLEELNSLNMFKIPSNPKELHFRKYADSEVESYYAQFHVNDERLEEVLGSIPDDAILFDSDPWKGERPSYGIGWWTIGEGSILWFYHISRETATVRISAYNLGDDLNLVQIHAAVFP